MGMVFSFFPLCYLSIIQLLFPPFIPSSALPSLNTLKGLVFFLIFIFNWRIIALQCCAVFCVYPFFLKPPPMPTPIPLLQVITEHRAEFPVLHSSFPRTVLHTVVSMFPCCSLHSSHPLLPRLCPQVCSLCLRFHCCPADRFISTIFLDSIYVH